MNLAEIVRQLTEAAAACGIRLRTTDEITDESTSAALVILEGDTPLPVTDTRWNTVVAEISARELHFAIDDETNTVTVAPGEVARRPARRKARPDDAE